MTVRLSAMFEEHIKKITSNWRIARKRLRCRSSSSESGDVNVTSSDEKSSHEVETIKVVVEKIEPMENGGLAAYDSDSDNTPLGALRGVSISNTESDNTQDKTSTDRNSELEKRLMPNGTQEYRPEPSTSSQSMLDDFDHNYTSKKSKANNCDNNQPSTSSLYHSDSSENEMYQPVKKLKNQILESESDASAENPNNASKSSNGSDSEESVNLLQLQSGLKAKQNKVPESDDQDEDFSPEESSTSSDHPAPSKRKPARRARRKSNSSDSDFELSDSRRKARRKRKPSFVVEDDEDDDEETESSPTNSSESDSDYSDDNKRKRKGGLRSKKSRKQKSDTDSDSDSPLRPRKRRRKNADSDLDNRQTNGRMRYLGNVSSRGRVRKITEKAAAFLKKDKKTG